MIRENDGAILCVGNFDSGTGYAWKLIEHLWTVAAEVGDEAGLSTLACYPTLSEINPVLNKAGIVIKQHWLETKSISRCFKSLQFIRKNKIRYLYLSDRATLSRCYFMYRLAGVKKIIVHDHTPGHRPAVTGIKKAVKTLINYLPWITVDYAIGVSPYVCERLALVNRVPEKKILSVTNGIDDCSNVKKYPVSSEELVRLVTVARVNYYKGVDFAIHSIHQLVQHCQITNIQYDVIGDGPELDTFKALVKTLGIEAYVNFLGKQSGVAALLPEYDIAFHPSKGEAMCLAIVEYMRAGLPVIVSTNPSVNSILQENKDSVFFQEGELSSAVDCLSGLVKDATLRQELGLSARARFETQYRAVLMDASFKSSLSSLFE